MGGQGLSSIAEPSPLAVPAVSQCRKPKNQRRRITETGTPNNHKIRPFPIMPPCVTSCLGHGPSRAIERDPSQVCFEQIACLEGSWSSSPLFSLTADL